MRTTTNGRECRRAEQGIDYGMGLANVDKTTGIRYGIISHHSLGADFLDEFEADYGEPTCPQCGNEVKDSTTFVDESEIEHAESCDNSAECDCGEYTPYSEYGCDDYSCPNCKLTLDSSEVSDEAIGFYLNNADYLTHYNNDGFGVWVERSPYYTYAHFCSPCAPGAGDLDTPIDVGDVGFGLLAHAAHLDKTYCFDHECFEDGKAPYRVFRVVDGTEVLPGE